MIRNSVIMRLYMDVKEADVDVIRVFFDSYKRYYTPKTISGTKLSKGELVPYTEEKFVQGIGDELLEDNLFTITVRDEGFQSMVSFRKAMYYTIISIVLSKEVFDDQRGQLLSDFKRFFQKFDGIVAYVGPVEDEILQNTESVREYQKRGLPTDHLVLRQHPLVKKRTIIDKEYNPGHSHFVNDLWFGSQWYMLYGPRYFSYVPKSALWDFQAGYCKDELENGAIAIQLYEDLWAYGLAENREVQWKFRRQTGVDDVAHSLLGIQE